MENTTFLSIEIVFDLLECAYLLEEYLQGLFSLGLCRGYFHLPVINSKEKRKGGGGRGRKGERERERADMRGGS